MKRTGVGGGLSVAGIGVRIEVKEEDIVSLIESGVQGSVDRTQ